MLSTCVLLSPDFNSRHWSDHDLKSLTFLYFKFDLFVLSEWTLPNHGVHWLEAHLKLRRVVADLNSDAKAESFFCLPEPIHEWLGNVDVFVDFPDSAQTAIDHMFPYRTYLEFKDVLNPDFMTEALPHDR